MSPTLRQVLGPVITGHTPGTTTRYGSVARGVHWLVAALAVVVISLGLAAGSTPHNSPARESLLLLHRSAGLTILALMAFRALWRWRHPPPPLPPTLAWIQARLAQLTHFGLYIVFIAMPLAGYLGSAAAGSSGSYFGLLPIPQLVPTNLRLSQWAIAAHLVGQYVVYLLVALHVAAALYHGLIRGDGVLDRMLPSRRATRLGS